VIALASGLLALAGIFAERSLVIARRAAVVRRLGPPSRASRRAGARRGGWITPAVVGVILALALAGSFVWAAAAAGAALVGHAAIRRRDRRRSARRREDQLVEATAAVAAGLRASLSLPQALAYARDESQPPLRDDLARLIERVDLGAPLGTALAGWADELGAEEARLIVGVLDLHRRSGGDLPAVLDGVVATLRERRAADREVRALTAQARLSGGILGTLPIGFFGFLMLTARHEMLDAIATPIGGIAIAVGLTLETAAFVWIRRLLEVR
jgi:tight adherence protein B